MPTRSLVADADPGVNALIAHVLTRAGHAVRQLPDPAAVAPDAAAGCDLVVLGGRRLGVSAAAVAERLRRAGVGTPVLILSNLYDPKVAALAGTDRGVRVLQKPVLPSRIAAVAAELVGPGMPSRA